MTDATRQPDYVRACLVWVFPLFVFLGTWTLGGTVLWSSFIAGALTTALVEIVALASWGFWTGRLR